VFSPAEQEDFETSTVADLRLTAGRYPDHPRVRTLIEQLCQVSEASRTRWKDHGVADHVHAAKPIEHPEVGEFALDCDVLTTQHGDLRIVVYTAPAESEAATKHALLAAIVTGFFRGCSGLQAGEESDACAAGQRQAHGRWGDGPSATGWGEQAHQDR
jgi:hypothetical protein